MSRHTHESNRMATTGTHRNLVQLAQRIQLRHFERIPLPIAQPLRLVAAGRERTRGAECAVESGEQCAAAAPAQNSKRAAAPLQRHQHRTHAPQLRAPQLTRWQSCRGPACAPAESACACGRGAASTLQLSQALQRTWARAFDVPSHVPYSMPRLQFSCRRNEPAPAASCCAQQPAQAGQPDASKHARGFRGVIHAQAPCAAAGCSRTRDKGGIYLSSLSSHAEPFMSTLTAQAPCPPAVFGRSGSA